MLLEFQEQKIFAFSDTQGKHRELVVLDVADILVCTGDVCEAGGLSKRNIPNFTTFQLYKV
jgi:hypothetical protein